MERLPQDGYMVGELVERLADDGIAEVKKVYPEGPKLNGAIEGFEIARSLCATYEDFDWAVTQRLDAEKAMRNSLSSSTEESVIDAYWQHRWATLQLEFCRDILLVAKYASGETLPPRTKLSARAVMRYTAIVSPQDL